MGDSYAEAKAKLEALKAEGIPSQSDYTREVKIQFKLPAPGGFVAASYIGQVLFNRHLAASVLAGTSDNLSLRFSAPSSGHQLIGMTRVLQYPTQADEPRVSELLARLSERMGGPPQRFHNKLYKFQFAKWRLVAPPGATQISCEPQYNVSTSGDVGRINAARDCDIVLVVEFQLGMSADHAKYIKFTLSDNERAKSNVGADFAFFDAYAADLQSRSRGVQPKL